jgi:hypothetical protein
MSNKPYLIVCQSKEAESTALATASTEVRRLTYPLVDITDCNSESDGVFEKHLGKAVDHVANGMKGWNRFLLDAFSIPLERRCCFENDLFADSRPLASAHYISYVLDALVARGLEPTPVFGFDRDDSYRDAVLCSSAYRSHGLGIRLLIEDIEDPGLPARFSEFIRFCSIPPSRTDVIFDLGYLAQRTIESLEALCSRAILRFERLGPFRSLFLLGSSFPRSITKELVARDSMGTIERKEVDLWERVRQRLPKDFCLGFGDYGVVNPTPSGGGTAMPNAKIRRTRTRHWIIARGHELNLEPKYSQYYGLAARVAAEIGATSSRPSWGESFLLARARRSAEPGNLADWVAADLSYHMHIASAQAAATIASSSVVTTVA